MQLANVTIFSRGTNDAPQCTKCAKPIEVFLVGNEKGATEIKPVAIAYCHGMWQMSYAQNVLAVPWFDESRSFAPGETIKIREK